MHFIASLSPKSNVEDVYTKYSSSKVFALTATLERRGMKGDEGGGVRKRSTSQHFCLWL